jgi:type IV secretory pathway TraG/TraD family ATPase VirD4
MDLGTAQNISGRLGRTMRFDVWKIRSNPLYERELMRPDELIRLRDNQLLVLHLNRDPVLLTTVPFYRRGDLVRRSRLPVVPLPTTVTEDYGGFDEVHRRYEPKNAEQAADKDISDMIKKIRSHKET